MKEQKMENVWDNLIPPKKRRRTKVEITIEQKNI